jgi:PAS domain S-box-containing protein
VDSRMQLLGDDTVLEVNRDVTAVKALHIQQAALLRELGATTAKFEALFNQSGIFAGILDLQGYVRDVNNLAVEACGYTKEQVLNRPFWETPWWRGSEQMKAKIRFATAQAASGSIFREELRYWIADGSERVVDFAMHPIRDQSGAVNRPPRSPLKPPSKMITKIMSKIVPIDMESFPDFLDVYSAA